ncbi:hypothetical protein DTO164E3_5056 [Paecilomyces variotii]|nr:hypothetical protein DTO032I3_7735 [Paecilomyces variotii]KAJ9198585.1 hypothetical protein DTO164E3_5056 [Paecilomyces variotii]KAJ9276265.1 hypothetical protein DTO021D3_6896 [Paecilomyces variotii]KAJ9323976.1 hypothetical protein DTO027B3_5057 [Paecilomyces variotii]KAJ9332220.1 hypothetical protein DTO027B5_6027 [Paecilomyces variotii]
MGSLARFFRIPRPETFLYVMSLETGASLITLSLLLNKISGLYGLLALLTGYHLSPVQLSMYVYSLGALGLTAFLFPHIRKHSPLQCLSLAWFYLLDSLINAAYTAAFGVTWFLVVSQHYHNAPTSGPGSETMEETAGFTNPKYNVSSVQAAAGPDAGVLSPGQGAVAAAHPATAPAGSLGATAQGVPSLGHGVLQPESFQSIGFICALWGIRIYFVLVMLAFARHALRQYVATGSPRHHQVPTHSRNVSVASCNAEIDRDPFSARSPDGQGWQGKLGRAMVRFPRSYWLGGPDDANWASAIGRRFRRRGEVNTGPTERERRRRSGTGPPLPSQTVVQAAALQQPIQVQGMHVKMHDWNDPR